MDVCDHCGKGFKAGSCPNCRMAPDGETRLRAPWGECSTCGAGADEPCSGWYWTSDGAVQPDGFDGEPCKEALTRHYGSQWRVSAEAP